MCPRLCTRCFKADISFLKSGKLPRTVSGLMFGGAMVALDIPSTYQPRSDSTCFIPFALPPYASLSSRSFRETGSAYQA